MVYLDLVMGLNFIVDLLLLLGTNSLAGYPPGLKRALLAAGIGGFYGGVCLLPGFRFLGNALWRLVFLGLMAVIAFGWNRSAVRRGALFIFLSMALGGIALGLGKAGGWSLIAAAAGVALLCVIGFQGKAGARKYAAVSLTWQGKTRQLTALHDTGNTLKDPVTGQQVLVVGAQIAWELMGLSPQQLQDPVRTMASGAVPGLRLIPYRAVGQPGGMLLGVKPDEVRFGGERREMIVAFAPQKLGTDGFEALAGGI